VTQAAATRSGVIDVDFAPGNLGNKMLQYLAALSLRERLPNFALSNIQIVEWQIDIPRIAQQPRRRVRYVSDKSAALDFDDIVARVDRGVDRVELQIYSSHMHNLPPVERARALFPPLPQVQGYGTDVLLINVRGSEILQAVHAEYTVLPVSFYRDIVARTGLRPVFLGQLDDSNRYVRSLKAAFPDAEFVGSRGAVHDFSAIAKSSNIVMAVSTFSWLAGWLSHADRIIMPLSGFMNPLQYPSVDLMPRGDARFEYYLFPENRAVVDAEIEEAHRRLEGQWRQVGYNEVNARRRVVPPVRPQSLFNKARRRVRRLLAAVRAHATRRKAA
jgi:hypothetical protein